MRRLTLVVLVAPLAGCSRETADRPAPAAGSSTTPAESSPSEQPPDFDQELHDELIEMFERDQSGHTGGPDAEGDAARTERLGEILDEHGWPTYDLVGEDGEDALWAIAQHSDRDPGRRGRGAADVRHPGRPRPGGPRPATPLADPAAVEGLRAAAGLEPLADYLAETAEICSAD